MLSTLQQPHSMPRGNKTRRSSAHPTRSVAPRRIRFDPGSRIHRTDSQTAFWRNWVTCTGCRDSKRRVSSRPLDGVSREAEEFGDDKLRGFGLHGAAYGCRVVAIWMWPAEGTKVPVFRGCKSRCSGRRLKSKRKSLPRGRDAKARGSTSQPGRRNSP